MVTQLRRLIAERLADALWKAGHARVEDLSQLAWAVRLHDTSKTPGVNAQLTVPFKHLRACGVLDFLPSQQQKEQAAKITSHVTTDRLVSHVVSEEQMVIAEVDFRYLMKKTIEAIVSEKQKYGLSGVIHQYLVDKGGTLIKNPQRQRVVIEYSSPNIAKPFHAGHLRSTILGNVLSNINEALGHQVTRLNFLGDWGTQFGLLAVGLEKYGSEDELNKNAMKHLFQVYVKINQDASNDDAVHLEGMKFFKRMEEGDPEALSVWQKCREYSVEEYSKVYKRLGVTFNEYDGESRYQKQAKNFVNQMRERGLLKYHSNSGVAFIDLATGDGKPLYANLVKSDGTTLYITRDTAAAIDRLHRYSFDKIHYVVENGQHMHFRQLLRILQKTDQDWANRNLDNFHVKFGRVEGMSTRRGEVVFLEDILDEAQARMLERMKSTQTTKVTDDLEGVADKLGTSAVIVQDLKEKRQRGYTFNWAHMLKFTGNTGVFLQYTHARLCSLEETCGVELNLKCSLDSLREPQSLALVYHLARFEEAVQGSYIELEPCLIVQYLFQLAHLTGAASEVLRVRNQPKDVAEARLLLLHCSRLTLANGLRLIGVMPLDKM